MTLVESGADIVKFLFNAFDNRTILAHPDVQRVEADGSDIKRYRFGILVCAVGPPVVVVDSPDAVGRGDMLTVQAGVERVGIAIQAPGEYPDIVGAGLCENNVIVQSRAVGQEIGRIVVPGAGGWRCRGGLHCSTTAESTRRRETTRR